LYRSAPIYRVPARVGESHSGTGTPRRIRAAARPSGGRAAWL